MSGITPETQTREEMVLNQMKQNLLTSFTEFEKFL